LRWDAVGTDSIAGGPGLPVPESQALHRSDPRGGISADAGFDHLMGNLEAA